MDNLMHLGAIAGVFVALVVGCATRGLCQEFASPVRDAGAEFLADAGQEAARGTYLFYTQEYRDQHKEPVSIHGSVYGVLRDVKLNGCEVEGTVQVNDLFSGSVNSWPTGEQQDVTEYSIRFRISAEAAAGMALTEARPSQLAHAMHTQCDGDASCTFQWLRIRATQVAMHERIVVNRSVTFDGPVKELLVPLSSREAGERLMRDVRALAETRCR